MSTTYQHTQTGYVIVACLFIGIAACLVSGAMQGWRPEPLAAGAICLLALVLFWSLTIEVGDGVVKLQFGPGIIRRRFRAEEIVSARAVKKPWYRGWGIRRIHGGWLFNVSGRDAVEIRMRNGRRYWLGTDEPETLLRAIRGAARLGE